VATAHYEGQILKALAAASADADDEAVERIPVLVASSTECLGNEEWSVRLAMTQIPGESLNRFIERHRTESDTLRPQPTPYEQLKTACFFTRELLSQLAPAFARISSLAYHRDVNPRNILIDDADRTQPRYGLIDFGLAVEATQWRLGTVEKAGEAVVGVWQVWGVGGDCRYWPVSSWLMLEQGPRALSSCPHLCMEYKTHLDLHALGVTALQVFMDLSPSPAHQEPTQEILEKLWTLHHAWERYWDDATCFWKRLFNAYRSGDNSDLSAVKAEYRRLAVHRQVGQSLSNLRVALAAVAEACEHLSPKDDLEDLPPVVHALLAMVSNGEETVRSSWRRIELLAERRVACSPGKFTSGGRQESELLRNPRKSAIASIPPVIPANTATAAVTSGLRMTSEGKTISTMSAVSRKSSTTSQSSVSSSLCQEPHRDEGINHI
jgi:serine/threonine protein kinase